MAGEPGKCPPNVYICGIFDYVEWKGTKYKVSKGCKHPSGGFYCEAHDKFFLNARESWKHTQEATAHKMCWICRKHGPEEP